MFPQLTALLARKPIILQLLRFACIGALNTAVDFVILNLLTNYLHIDAGSKLLAYVNVVGVTVAIVQSYYWNKYWAFAADSSVSVLKHFFGMVLVGGLGFCTFIAAILPSVTEVLADPAHRIPVLSSLVGIHSAHPVSVLTGGALYYGVVLLLFFLLQIIIGVNIGFHKPSEGGVSTEFGKFILVSVIGVVINSLVLAGLAAVILHAAPSLAASFVKNVAKLIAVFVSLAWNFVGYKLFVFKR